MSYNFSSQPWKPSHYNVHPWRFDISSLHQRSSRPSRVHCADQGSNSQFCPKFMMICLLSWRKARMPSIGLCNFNCVPWKPSRNTREISSYPKDFVASFQWDWKIPIMTWTSRIVIMWSQWVRSCIFSWPSGLAFFQLVHLGGLPKAKARPTQPTKSPTDKLNEKAAVPHESFEPLNMMTWMFTWKWNVTCGNIAVLRSN